MIRVVLGGRSYFRHTCLMPGGAIPASTGRNVVSVGRMHPVIIRLVSFSALKAKQDADILQLKSTGVLRPTRK